MNATLYAERRARLVAALGPNGIAIVPTAPERPRNRDSDFLYRHDSYFYYLTGFTEPNAYLVLCGDRAEWPGPAAGAGGQRDGAIAPRILYVSLPDRLYRQPRARLRGGRAHPHLRVRQRHHALR